MRLNARFHLLLWCHPCCNFADATAPVVVVVSVVVLLLLLLLLLLLQSVFLPLCRSTQVVRILTPMFAVGIMDGLLPFGDHSANVSSPAHDALSRQIAAAATVLLKNDAPAGSDGAFYHRKKILDGKKYPTAAASARLLVGFVAACDAQMLRALSLF